MKYSALIGKPTEHSVSHIMFGEIAKAAGLHDPYQHIRVDVNRSELAASLDAFNTLHFIGLNVTLPYKLDVIDCLEEVDPIASELGAVNTVKLGQTTTGYNTDWAGITESVRQFGTAKVYETATIFGTGGTARAAIYACKQLGAKDIHILYRHEASEATRNLQEQTSCLGITLHAYSEVSDAILSSQLVINATSAGMVGKDPLPFGLDSIKNTPVQDKVFVDAVFNPLETPLIRYFKLKGAATIDGLWMMLYQGVAALSIWLGHKVEVSTSDLVRMHGQLAKELKNNA